MKVLNSDHGQPSNHPQSIGHQTRLLSIFTIILASILVLQCAAIMSPRSSARNGLDIVVPRELPNQCPPIVAGNPDFYGLGIRIGVYLQWISSMLANLLSPEAIDSNLDTNTIFLLALFVAMVVAASGKTQRLATPEIVVLLQLCFGFLFSVLTIWGYRTRTSVGDPVRFPLLGSTIRIALATLISAFAVWFWFFGLDRHEPENGCDSVTFIFAEVSVNGGVAIFYKIQSIVVVVVYVLLFLQEYLLIGCFLVYTAMWTSFFAAFSIVFSPQVDAKYWEHLGLQLETWKASGVPPRGYLRFFVHGFLPAMRTLRAIFWQWIQLSSSIFWANVNGEKSVGNDRPKLSVWIAPFIKPVVFCIRSTFQWWCLFLFGWCPPVSLIPPAVQVRLDHKWDKMSKKFHLLFVKRFTLLYDQQPGVKPQLLGTSIVNFILYVLNGVVVVWTIIAVELTLSWNQVPDIYTLQSTGQLIPFIIGIVSFLRVAHGLTIQLSVRDVTDFYFKLFDNTTETQFDDVKGLSLRRLEIGNKTVYISKKRKKKIEFKDKPFFSRSLETSSMFEMRCPPYMTLENDNRNTYRNISYENVDSYGSDDESSIAKDSNLERFSRSDGTKVMLYKDFQKEQPEGEDYAVSETLTKGAFETADDGRLNGHHMVSSAAIERHQRRFELRWRRQKLNEMNARLFRQHERRRSRSSGGSYGDRSRAGDSGSSQSVSQGSSQSNSESANSSSERVSSEGVRSGSLSLSRGPSSDRSRSRSRSESPEREPTWLNIVAKKDSFYALRLTLVYVSILLLLPVFLIWWTSRALIRKYPWIKVRAINSSRKLVRKLIEHYESYWTAIEDINDPRDVSALTKKEKRQRRAKGAMIHWIAGQKKVFGNVDNNLGSRFQWINVIPSFLATNGKYIMYLVLRLLDGMLKSSAKESKHQPGLHDLDASHTPQHSPAPSFHGVPASSVHSDESGGGFHVAEGIVEGIVAGATYAFSHRKGRPAGPEDDAAQQDERKESSNDEAAETLDDLRVDRAGLRELKNTGFTLVDYFQSQQFQDVFQKRSLPLLILQTSVYAKMIAEDRNLPEASRWMNEVQEAILNLKAVRTERKREGRGRTKQHKEAMKVWNEIIVLRKWSEIYNSTNDRIRERKKELLLRGEPLSSPSGSASSSREGSKERPKDIRRVRRFSWPP